MAAEDADDSDCEVFRVKRRSGITPERRHTEDSTITTFTGNQVLKRLKKIHADDRQQQKLVEVSCGTIDPVHTHHSRHCLDFISGNGDDSVHPTKLKMLHQLDANIMEDEFASSQKHNGCNYLSPSVELGPKRLKILGPSFPRGNHSHHAQ